MNHHKPKYSMLIYAIAFGLPTLTLASKIAGPYTAVAYMVFLIAALTCTNILERLYFLWSKIPENKIVALTIIGAIFITIIFSIGYPIANSGKFGPGSDRDEAINIATTALFNGDFPYTQKTYFGNPITPGPGALLLSSPFVLAGNGAYQNIFWIIALVGALKYLFKSLHAATFTVILIFLLSPASIHEYITGGDTLTNSIYITIFSLLTIKSVRENKKISAETIFMAIMLGISFSSRANYLLIVPILFVATRNASNTTIAIKVAAISAFAFLLVTVPIYLWDPINFTPLHTTRKLTTFNSIIPHLDLAITILTLTISLVLCKYTNHRNFLTNSTIVIATPIAIGTVLYAIKSHRLDFSYASFGVLFLAQAATAFTSFIAHTDDQATSNKNPKNI
jgi:hypothetical protein